MPTGVPFDFFCPCTSHTLSPALLKSHIKKFCPTPPPHHHGSPLTIIGSVPADHLNLDRTHCHYITSSSDSTQPVNTASDPAAPQAGAGASRTAALKELTRCGRGSCHGSTFGEMRPAPPPPPPPPPPPHTADWETQVVCLSEGASRRYLLISGRNSGAICGAGSRRGGGRSCWGGVSLPCRRQRRGTWIGSDPGNSKTTNDASFSFCLSFSFFFFCFCFCFFKCFIWTDWSSTELLWMTATHYGIIYVFIYFF